MLVALFTTIAFQTSEVLSKFNFSKAKDLNLETTDESLLFHLFLMLEIYK